MRYEPLLVVRDCFLQQRVELSEGVTARPLREALGFRGEAEYLLGLDTELALAPFRRAFRLHTLATVADEQPMAVIEFPAVEAATGQDAEAQVREEAVRAASLLAWLYFESLLAPAGVNKPRLNEVRAEWHEQALIATAPADIVFLDPDNGVPVDVGAPSLKHALFEELRDYRARDQSVFLYHHLTRKGTHAEQLARLADRLAEEIPGPAQIVLRASRGSARAFAMLPADRHERRIRKHAHVLLAGPWSELFDQGA